MGQHTSDAGNAGDAGDARGAGRAGQGLFGSVRLAAGYAADRPAVHPRVIDLASGFGWLPEHPDVVLDLGCGAGASTRAIATRAGQMVAVDPMPEMVAALRLASPALMATAVVAAAESLPLADCSIDLVTAAGSLDFVHDLDRSISEVGRVLVPGGRLLVYDFGTGERLASGPDLATWFVALRTRHPRPPGRPSPFTVAGVARAADHAGLACLGHETFDVMVPMTKDRYVAYLLTESNVTSAIADGAEASAITAWMDATLPWPDDEVADVVFGGYLVAYDRA